MENMESEKKPSDEESNDEEEHQQMEESSSDEDDELEEANKAEVKRLQAVLEQNPFDYASHITLIALLQKMGELESLREARQNMSEKYPLSAEIWLAWIKDEINIATTQEQKEQVVQLCERAVKDYLCNLLFIFMIFNIEKELFIENLIECFVFQLLTSGWNICNSVLVTWELNLMQRNVCDNFLKEL